jgi:hypothetical protein
MKNSLWIILIAIFVYGCSIKDFFTLGESKTICEEENCDYKDAGVCMNPFDILEDKEYVKNNAYKDYEKGKKLK